MKRQDLSIRYFATPELARRMREQGRRATWAAQLLGVSKSHFHHVLNGRRPVTEANARLLAGELGLPLFLLWELSDGGDMALSDSSLEVAS